MLIQSCMSGLNMSQISANKSNAGIHSHPIKPLTDWLEHASQAFRSEVKGKNRWSVDFIPVWTVYTLMTFHSFKEQEK